MRMGNRDTVDNLWLVGRREKTRPPRKVTLVASFLAICLLGGVAFASVSAPLISTAISAEEEFETYWNALPEDLPDAPPPQRSKIYDVNGKKMAEFFAENRIMVDLDDVSPYVADALISTEDRNFYKHEGVDWKGIGRAVFTNATNDTFHGASTITQQLVKNTLLINASDAEEQSSATEISVYRKIQEVKYARALEEKYTKDEILEKYLNVVLYSNGVYGIGTASSYYFNKKAKDLNIQEAAMLIGLLKNPSAYDPIDHAKVAKSRRNVVIDLMVDNGVITAKEGKKAKKAKLGLDVKKPVNGCAPADDPYYCQLVIQALTKDPKLGKNEAERESIIYRGGLKVHTYYDPKVHKTLQRAVDDALGQDNRVAAGIATVEPGTGIVKGIAQNRTWGDGEDKNGKKKTQVIYPNSVSFQSGSTFKVFTLVAALEAGWPLHAVINAPTVYNPSYMNVPPGGITNLSSIGAGRMNVYKGTARSSNTFYAALSERIGVMNVAAMAESMGISVPREGPTKVGAKDASFTLGTISVSPIQMAAANAAIAGGGIYCEPVYISKVTGPRGKKMPVSDGNCRRVMSPQTAANVTDVLKGVIDGPDEFRTAEDAHIGRPVAGKTGTTNQQAAVWFAGFTPQNATAVWVGDPRGGQKYPLAQGLRYYGSWTNDVWGSTISAPIWKQAMVDLHKGVPVKGFPSLSGQGIGSTLPDVRGMRVQDAVNLLHAEGYTVKIAKKNAVADEYATPDHVAGQDPLSTGVRPSRKATITLTLTDGSKKWTISK